VAVEFAGTFVLTLCTGLAGIGDAGPGSSGAGFAIGSMLLALVRLHVHGTGWWSLTGHCG
jgi:hypothetical protein